MASIKINDVLPTNQYTASGGETTFVYDYPIRNESDLLVYQTLNGNVPDDAAQKIILNVDYTVTGVGAEGGGTIIFANPVAAGDRITIYRRLPYERLQNYVDEQDFSVESFNRDFNNIIMMIQQSNAVLEKLDNLYQKTEVVDSDNFKLPVLGANQIWKKSSLGPIEAVTFEEDPDVSTLRSELANDQSGTDGARLIGYYDSVGGSQTVKEALDRLQESSFGTDTGSVNQIEVTVGSAPVAYYSGYTLKVRIDNTNTATTTLKVNALVAVTVVALQQGVLTTLGSGALVAGMIAEFVYDATAGNLKLMNPNVAASEGVLAEIRYGHFEAGLVPVGWFFYLAGTIGDALSGATVRANADTQNLYVYYWNNYSSPSGNTIMPVTGILGASAIDDYNAHKSMRLPELWARAIGVGGTLNTDPTYSRAAGQFNGSITHLLSAAEMPPHLHRYTRFDDAQAPAGAGFSPQSGGFGKQTLNIDSSVSGGGTAFEHIGPVGYVNAMIKL
ncbi:MAG: hypothetical protein V3V84_00760 [Candidatus Bathyarchaeia archaeon]